MKLFSWHIIWVLAIGYLLGYYFRGLGNMTVARIYPPSQG